MAEQQNMPLKGVNTCGWKNKCWWPAFLAPLAEGQRAIVMAWWRRASVRPSVRASVNFFFKKLLLRNYWLDFNQISQEYSLGGPLSNSFK